PCASTMAPPRCTNGWWPAISWGRGVDAALRPLHHPPAAGGPPPPLRGAGAKLAHLAPPPPRRRRGRWQAAKRADGAGAGPPCDSGRTNTGMKSQYGEVSVETRGHVALLTFSRPPNNHVSVESMRALADALGDIDAETSVRASVLTSSGKVFCAGADLVNPGGVGAEGMQGINPLYVEAVRLFSAKKPIVAAVQGAAVGAGLGLALVADFRVAAPEARFTSNFVKLGFHPGFGVTYTLPRLIGQQRAALMCLTGRRINGETALEWGLADVLAPLDSLLDESL